MCIASRPAGGRRPSGETPQPGNRCRSGRPRSGHVSEIHCRETDILCRGSGVRLRSALRFGREKHFECDNPDRITPGFIAGSFLIIGIEIPTSGCFAFLYFTDDLILKKSAPLLPQEQVVIEIPETVDPSPEVVSACRYLKERGCRLAPDDFIALPELDPLSGLAPGLASRGILLLAEKVQTRRQFRGGRDLGFQNFQGFFPGGLRPSPPRKYTG